MSFFAKATDPPVSKTKNSRQISLLLAVIFLIMIIAQLFSFEKFPDIIAAMNLPGGQGLAKLQAAVIVTLEVFALPFLLAMRLSPAMRVFSMIAGWLAIGGWVITAIIMNKTDNSGILGATVSVPAGWWIVFFALGMGVLAAWAAWGAWPLLSKEIQDGKNK